MVQLDVQTKGAAREARALAHREAERRVRLRGEARGRQLRHKRRTAAIPGQDGRSDVRDDRRHPSAQIGLNRVDTCVSLTACRG